MPGTSVPKRPQTLKQAKKAYQKSNAVPGLSKTDLKHLQRAAELQERADRIKKREAQKIMNRQKKMEKEQKEREARKRMGMPEPNKGYVSPRQERLSQFVRAGGRRKESCAEEISTERVEESEESDQSLEDLLVDHSRFVERGSPTRAPKPTTLDRQPLQQESSPLAATGNAVLTHSDDWDAFFVTNTQIGRELTEDESEDAGEETKSMPVDRGFVSPVKDGTEELLRHLATQDLDFDMDESEGTIPVEETLPMFPSQEAESSEEDLSESKREAKDKHHDMARAEDLAPYFLTQELDFSDDDFDGENLQLVRSPTKGVGGGTTTAEDSITTEHMKHATATDEYDDGQFEFASQDLLELENAPAAQNTHEEASRSSTPTTQYSSDLSERDEFDVEDYIADMYEADDVDYGHP
ncbi:hypothetical protein MMC16_004845 [Acarospora aff. strigata]|nr:hypothetical protein [Acarospora aff. strigata]